MTKANSDFKKRFQAMLDKLDLAQPVTVSDIEDIVWNEHDVSDINRLVMMLLEGANAQQMNDVVQLVQEAWNTFPHQSLGGKAPNQMYGEHANEPAASLPVGSSRKRKTLSDVFASNFPEQTRLIPIGDAEWGFEYPQQWHALTEQFSELEESGISGKAYEQKLKDMLVLIPELFDVADSLAQYYGAQHDFRKVKLLYENEIKLARKYIPKEFIPGKHRIIWAYLDNRPFLRMLDNYAQFIEQTEKVSKAIPLYEELLSFNPNDNQGVRYVLATAYLKTNQPERLLELAAEYPEEIGPDLVMGKVLALLKLGMVDEARKYLKKNKKYQKHVIRELLKPAHSRPEEYMDDRITVGGEDEAWYYWRNQGSLWEATKGAKDFLKEFTAT